MLNKQHQLVSGNLSSNKNYPQYGKPVIAAAPGKIVRVYDGLPDQQPGELSQEIPIEDAAGNYVIQDIGHGYYALYAHLQPHSIVVKTGQSVGRGQKLGLLGNSGNSSAPHLHFHLMKGDLPLSYEGVPFALDHFKLLGKANLPLEGHNIEAEIKTLKTISINKKGSLRKNEMPEAKSVVEFDQ